MGLRCVYNYLMDVTIIPNRELSDVTVEKGRVLLRQAIDTQ